MKRNPFRKLFASEGRNPKLFRSRWALWTYAFAVLFVIGAVSGYVIAAWPQLDLGYYFLLNAHVGVGNAGLVLLCLLSAVHLQALYGKQARNLVLMVFLFFFGMTLTDFGPLERFFIPLAILVFGTVRYLLPTRKSSAGLLWVGVATFFVLAVVYGTGWSIAGWARQQRTNLAADVHDTLGWLAPPLVLFHLFWGFPFREDPRTKRAIAGLIVASILVFGGSLHNRQVEMARAVETARDEGIPNHARLDDQTCGTARCHSEIWKEWETSSHRFSAVNIPYAKVAELAEAERGPAARQSCRGCHEPDVPLSGSRIGHDPAQLAGVPPETGITCRGCHLIGDVREPAWNGEYSFAKETLYLPGQDLANSRVMATYLDFIPLEARDHRANFTQAVVKSPKLCVTCHRIEIPAESNGARQFVFDGPGPSWATSSFAAKGVECSHCHLQLFEFYDPDSSERGYHARPDHRFFGIHAHLGDTLPAPNPIPKARWDLFRDATVSWLSGGLQVSRFERTFLFYTGDARSKAWEVFTGHSVLDVKVGARREGGEVVIDVATTNSRIGHRFPVSLLDLSDVWLEVTVTDGGATPVFVSGALDVSGDVPPDAHRLGADVVDKDGQHVEYHRIWVAAGLRNERFVNPGQTIHDELRFPAAPDLGAVTVKARWIYRRYDRQFSEWAFGPGAHAPLVEVGGTSANLALR